MKSKGVILGILAVVILAALIVSNRPAEQPPTKSTQSAQAVPPQPTPSAPNAAAEPVTSDGKPVPHFHARLEDALPLPKILPASDFSIPIVARAYAAAARIPEVLAQQPCYCWCDKMGHGSLVDCFATDHGAG